MIHLREIRESDLPYFLKWRNDKSLNRYFRTGWHALTVIDEARWFEGLAGDGKQAMFAIEESWEGSNAGPAIVVGCAGLTSIDRFERAAEVSLYIGDNYIDARAEEALKHLASIAFLGYNLHRLWCEVWAFDDKKQEILKACDFAHEGTHAKAHWYNGSWHDSVWYGLVNKG